MNTQWRIFPIFLDFISPTDWEISDTKSVTTTLSNLVASYLTSSPRKPTFKRVRSTSFPSDITIHISEILPHLLKIFAWISSVILCVGFSIRLLKFSLLSLLLTSHQILNSSHEKLYPSRRYLFTLLPTHCLVNQLSIFKANSRYMMEKISS